MSDATSTTTAAAPTALAAATALCASCGAETAAERDTCARCGADTRLDGRYRLLGRLGHGASGTTYRAIRVQDGLPVAIKALLVRQLEDFKAHDLFAREAATLEALKHPGIPRYHDDFTAGDGRRLGLYLVTELIDGHTLEEELRDRRHTAREIIDIACALCDILTYLHGLAPPVVHRDIKPSNIMRRKDGSLVLIDFGAVKESLRGGELGGSTVAGTFGYMPPEQLVGRATPASDLYALGVLIVALSTRKPLQEMLDDLNRLQWREHMPSGSAEADGLRAVLADLLQPDPSRRLADAALLKRRLVAVLDGRARARAPSPLPITPWEGRSDPRLGDGMTAAIFHEGQEAATRWWETRELVWPVGATSSFQIPLSQRDTLYSPADLGAKVCGPPAYGFRYSQNNSHPARGWGINKATGDKGILRGVLTLDYGRPVAARAIYVFNPRHSHAGFQGIHRLALIDERDQEEVIYTREPRFEHGDESGPALLVIDLGSVIQIRRLRVHAVNSVSRGTVIDAVGLFDVERTGSAAPVDHRPRRIPELQHTLQSMGMMLAFLLIIGLLGYAIYGGADADAGGEPTVEAANAVTAALVSRDAVPALSDPSTLWVRNAGLHLRLDDGSWHPERRLREIIGPPDGPGYTPSHPAGEHRNIAARHDAGEVPIQAVAIIGEGLENAVRAVVIEPPDGDAFIWRAPQLRPLPGEVLRLTLPRATPVRAVDVIISGGVPARVDGIALLPELNADKSGAPRGEGPR